MSDRPDPRFCKLRTLLARVPSMQTNDTVSRGFGSGFDDSIWWLKYSLDIDHACAWRVVQEFGNILNYVSIEDRLPTVFKPVSPPVCLNGGPRDYLSRVIECPIDHMTPDIVAEYLEARLPSPIDQLQAWELH